MKSSFFLLSLLLAPAVLAEPVLFSVVEGVSRVSRLGDTTTITQTSDSTTLQWQKFNVSGHERVVFNQPSTSAIAVNEVISANRTEIFGEIIANGRVVLLNPNGIYFGRNSQVSAHTFIAAAASLANSRYDSVANRLYIRNEGNMRADITAAGTIQTVDTLQLVARNVYLSSGSLQSERLVAISAKQDISLNSSITSSGAIDLFAGLAISGGGDTNSRNTRINSSNYLSLSGSHHSNVSLSLSANTILINTESILSSRQVEIIATSSALISASITAVDSVKIVGIGAITLLSASIVVEGGSVIIGSRQISPQEITISPGSTIDVSAGLLGDAGSITIYSAGTTSFYGTLLAQGGTNGGNGGFIELSGRGALKYHSLDISTTAQHGTTGTLVIDPPYIVVTDLPLSVDLFQQSIMRTTQAFSLRGSGGIVVDGSFGIAVALNNNNQLLVGASSANASRGGAYLYNILQNSWLDLLATTGAPSTQVDSNFGSAIALDNNFALISAPGTITDGSSIADILNPTQFSGTVYIYRLDASNYFSANCLSSAVGTSAWCDLSATDTNPSMPGNQNPILSLNAIPGVRHAFGSSLATNGTLAIIGASIYTDATIITGNAYLYNLNGNDFFNTACETTGGTSPWCDLSATGQNPVSGFTTTKRFGYSVAINDTFAVIGGRNTDSPSSVYIYNLSGEGLYDATCSTIGTAGSPWCNVANTPDSPFMNLPASSEFGSALALNDDFILVGDFTAAYDPDSDPDTDNSIDNVGTGYLYRFNDSSWFNLATLSGSPIATAPEASFIGFSVALTDNIALLGAPNYRTATPSSIEPLEIGNVLLFQLCVLDATPCSTPHTNFITVDDDLLTDGIQNNITAQDLGSRFGAAIAANDIYIVAGAPDAIAGRGNVFLFRRRDAVWLDLYDISTSRNLFTLSTSLRFSTSVAISENTTSNPFSYLLIGAPGAIDNRGNAYLYESVTGTWIDLFSEIESNSTIPNRLASCTGTPCVGGSRFGASVALSEEYAIIGAPNASTGAMSNILSGDVYLYRLDGRRLFNQSCEIVSVDASAWCSVSSVTNFPILAAGDEFGFSVSALVSTLLIGAPGTSSNRGTAFLYNLNNTAFYTTNCSTSGVITNRWCNLISQPGQRISLLGPGARFGVSVDNTVDTAIIGAPGTSSSKGNALLYRLDGNPYFNSSCGRSGPTTPWCSLSSSVPTLITEITGLNDNSLFGHSVAISSDYALIGAPGVDSSRGSVYIYRVDGSTVFNNSCDATLIGSSRWCNLSSSNGNPFPVPIDSRGGYALDINDTYAVIGFAGISSGRGGAYLYKLDGTDTYTSDCRINSTGNSPWCNLAKSRNQLVTANNGSKSTFGFSIAVNGSHTLIGAVTAHGGLGNAYLYSLDSTNSLTSDCRGIGTIVSSWCDIYSTIPNTILPSNIAPLGISVAIDGDYALFGVPGANNNRGNALLYQISTELWFDLTLTTNSPVMGLDFGSRFGYSVALHKTEYNHIEKNITLVAIGAPGVEGNRGNVYLYSPDNSTIEVFSNNCQLFGSLTSAWCDLAAIDENLSTIAIENTIRSLSQNSFFGESIALNSATIVTGAPGVDNSTGNAYLYRLDGREGYTSNCQTTGTLTNRFCSISSVSLNPLAIYTADAGFGSSVAINSTAALIGAPGFSMSSGSVVLYRLDGTNSYNSSCSLTVQTQSWCYLSFPSPSANFDAIGHSVALSEEFAVIGAPGTGQARGDVYVYRLDGSDYFGSTCQILGSTNSPWCTLSASTGTGEFITGLADGSNAGVAVAIHNRLIAFGASGRENGRGGVFLYDIDDTRWTDLAILSDSPVPMLSACLNDFCSDGANFGSSIAISSNFTLIGSPGAQSRQGGLFLFSNVYQSGTDTTIYSSSDIEALLSSSNLILMADVDVSILASITYRGTNVLTIAQTTGASTGFTINGRFEFLPQFEINVARVEFSSINDIGTKFSPVFFTNVEIISTFISTRGDIYIGSPNNINSIINSRIILAGGRTLSLTQQEGNIARSMMSIGRINFPDHRVVINALDRNDGMGNIQVSAISALQLEINTFRGDIGSQFDPLAISRNSGSWNATNLILRTLSNSAIYVSHQTSVIALVVGTYVASKLSLFQNTGDIEIHNPIDFSGFELSLNAMNGGIVSTVTLNAITADAISLVAFSVIGSSTQPISVTAAIPGGNLSALTQRTTLLNPLDGIYITTTSDITIGIIFDTNIVSIRSTMPSASIFATSTSSIEAATLFITTGTIGSMINHLSITQAGGNWSDANLVLTATGSIYIQSGSDNTISATINSLTSGTFSLMQTNGNINIARHLSHPMATIRLNAMNGAINTSLTTTTITSSNLFINSFFDIGSEVNPLFVNRTSGLWSSTSLVLITPELNSIYLTHPSQVTSLALGSFTTENLIFHQSNGNIAFTQAYTFTDIRLFINAPQGGITTTDIISALSINLTAINNIGTSSTNPFLFEILNPTESINATSTLGSIHISTNSMNFLVPGIISAQTSFSLLTAGSIEVSPITSITANSVLINAMGDIGTESNPLTFLRVSGSWTSTNLVINTINTASIYLIDATDIDRFFPGNFTAGLVHLQQSTGNIVIDNSVNFNIPVEISALQGSILTGVGSPVLSAQALSLLALNDIGSDSQAIAIIIGTGTNRDLSASSSTGSIYISSAFSITLNTIVAFDTFSLSSPGIFRTMDAMIAADIITIISTGDIGTAALPFLFTRRTGSWSSSNLMLSTPPANAIHIMHPSNVVNYFAGSFTSGNIFFSQTVGNISIDSSLILPMSSLSIRALAGSIFTSAGVMLEASALTLHAIAATGSLAFLGTPSSPLHIVNRSISGSWNSSNLNLSGHGAYLITSEAGALDYAYTITIPLITDLIIFNLNQTSGNIIIDSLVETNSSTIDLASEVILRSAGAISTTLTTTAIRAANIRLFSNGDIGSSALPLSLDTLRIINGTIAVFQFNSGIGNSIYLSNAGAINLNIVTATILIAPTRADNYVYTHATGNLTSLPRILNFLDANFTLVVPQGAIIRRSNSRITARSITLDTRDGIEASSALTLQFSSGGLASAFFVALSASNGSIGTAINPIIINLRQISDQWSSTNLFLSVPNLATSGVYLASMNLGLLSAIPTYAMDMPFIGTYSIIQTIGNITIRDEINQPDLELIIIASANSGTITVQNNITTRALSLTAENIATSSPNHKITSTTLALFATAGNIGTTSNRVWISSGMGEPNFSSLSILVGPNNRNVFIRRDQVSPGDNSSLIDVRSQVLANRQTNVVNSYTVTVFNDAVNPYNSSNDIRFTVSNGVISAQPSNNILDMLADSLEDVLTSVFDLFGVNCDTDLIPSNNALSELLSPLCP